MVEQSNYDKFPTIKVNYTAGLKFEGYDSILKHLESILYSKNRCVCVIETYPGVYDDEILSQIKKLKYSILLESKDYFKDENTLNKQLYYNLTDDRVFGRMYYGNIEDFVLEDKIKEAKKLIEDKNGLIIIYGFGASLFAEADCLIYCDLARWEIQKRYRKGMPNYNCTNGKDDVLKKYKRGFFIEWRVADKLKVSLFDKIDYLLDTNIKDNPKMIDGNSFRFGLEHVVNRPFRTVPYFDPGVWGGQWMKNVCNLDKKEKNYAWSFDGVPEENSLYLQYDNVVIEVPAIDVVLYQPEKLLGRSVFARFGAEFPISFDFLDTIDGENLSLQVHPITEYIKKQFGMTYTQDESYYILDAKDDAVVYLGLKENIDKNEMISDLEKSNITGENFDADKYINKFKAKKHDHFLIPAGTCHCSGRNAMVLEISATPYIFTFKLWDWGRLGLDGKPRPIHIEHGKKVIDWRRTTKWVEKNLVNAIYEVENNNDYKEEHTGLHELEFIETRRFWIKNQLVLDTHSTVNMLNLVEGKEAIIESIDNSFEPFVVHYAETFIVPASIDKCLIKPGNNVKEIAIIDAYVRT